MISVLSNVLFQVMRVFKINLSIWKNKRFFLSVYVNTVLLVVSLFLTFFAKQYTATYPRTVVQDIVLDHIPVVNVAVFFFQGAFIFGVMLVCVLILLPRYLPFTLGCSGLFFTVRSIFMTMTHLSAPVVLTYSYIEYEHPAKDILFNLSSGNDLFFSGHAGYPFLLALIFWDQIYLRYALLACSCVGAITVLVGHLHYSIDVFSAYFIAFGIFSVSKIILEKDWSRIENKSVLM